MDTAKNPTASQRKNAYFTTMMCIELRRNKNTPDCEVRREQKHKEMFCF